MAPVVMGLQASGDLEAVVAVTAQHRSMLDQVLDTFGITPDHDLDISRDRQTLTDITSLTLGGLETLLETERPDLMVVQGDTTTAFAAALAGFYAQVPVAHVEAGLRTGDSSSPYPEEVNRRLISQLATLHLAPTPWAAGNLAAEGLRPEFIVCTGNTVIDALAWTVNQPDRSSSNLLANLSADRRRVILVTVHRRESWGGHIAGIARALASVARANPDVVIVLPIHKNPVVREALLPVLGPIENVIVVEPLPYGEFARLLVLANLVVTDSGGIQEEAPSLGKPVLVLRDVTERPEAVAAGTVEVVGTDESYVAARIQALLDDSDLYARMAFAQSPYGDGRAGPRSVAAIRWLLGGGHRPDEFHPPAPPKRRSDARGLA